MALKLYSDPTIHWYPKMVAGVTYVDNYYR